MKRVRNDCSHHHGISLISIIIKLLAFTLAPHDNPTKDAFANSRSGVAKVYAEPNRFFPLTNYLKHVKPRSLALMVFLYLKDIYHSADRKKTNR